MEEIWKCIPSQNNIYQASNLGGVRSLDHTVYHSNGRHRIQKGRILKTRIGRSGYVKCSLSYKGKRLYTGVHRLVAEAFIPNPENKPCVNHKNGIKTDNRVENLEWCTYSENTIHSYNKDLQQVKTGKDSPLFGKRNYKISKKLIDKKSGKIYNSIRDASEDLNIIQPYLSQMLHGKKKNKTNLIFHNDTKTSI